MLLRNLDCSNERGERHLIFLAYLQLILPFGEQVKGVMASESSPLVYVLNVIIFFGSIFKIYMLNCIYGG